MDVPPLVPARILNEHVYCPRLAYLEWVDQRFEDNADTAHGTFVHRGVHKQRGTPPEPDEDDPRPASTAIDLSSEELGLIAKVDLLESRDATVVPIEYKRGAPRSDEEPLHASSSAKRPWNSMIVSGKLGRGTPQPSLTSDGTKRVRT